MGWTVRGSNVGGARFSARVQSSPGAHPSSYAVGAGSFQDAKQSGRGVDHTPPYSAEVKERVELNFYSPDGPSWPVLWQILLFYLCFMLQRVLIEFPSLLY